MKNDETEEEEEEDTAQKLDHTALSLIQLGVKVARLGIKDEEMERVKSLILFADKTGISMAELAKALEIEG